VEIGIFVFLEIGVRDAGEIEDAVGRKIFSFLGAAVEGGNLDDGVGERAVVGQARAASKNRAEQPQPKNHRQFQSVDQKMRVVAQVVVVAGDFPDAVVVRAACVFFGVGVDAGVEAACGISDFLVEIFERFHFFVFSRIPPDKNVIGEILVGTGKSVKILRGFLRFFCGTKM
jgi:hypothetical protein